MALTKTISWECKFCGKVLTALDTKGGKKQLDNWIRQHSFKHDPETWKVINDTMQPEDD